MGHALKNGDKERGRFACAGLGLYKHITPLERVHKRLSLHGHAV